MKNIYKVEQNSFKILSIFSIHEYSVICLFNTLDKKSYMELKQTILVVWEDMTMAVLPLATHMYGHI